MPQKTKSILVNMKADSSGRGININKVSIKSSHPFKEVERAHRDDFYVFILQQKGTMTLEIDFQKYKVKAGSVVFIHPTQVHRVIGFEGATFSSWALSTEHINPDYLKLLDDLKSVKPLALKQEIYSIISDAVSLSIKLSERKKEKLHDSLLKESCNMAVGLVISQFLEEEKPLGKFSRFENVTKNFKIVLEQKFISIKSPSGYAAKLNISTPYLNECVKNATGHSVSFHIRERIILEAKRLLYHSSKSVKEIAETLGYDDYSYFIRTFSKIVGLSPLAFRDKNLE